MAAPVLGGRFQDTLSWHRGRDSAMSVWAKLTSAPNPGGRRKPNVPLENQPFSDRGVAPYPRLSTTAATAPAAPHNTTDTTASTSAAFIVLVFMVPRFMNPK